jgi:aminopeptidase
MLRVRKFSTKVIGAFKTDHSIELLNKNSALMKLLPSTFKAEKNELIQLYNPSIAIIGLGEKSKLTSQIVRNAAATATTKIKSQKSDTPIEIKFEDLIHNKAAAEGATIASYNYDLHKSQKNKKSVVAPKADHNDLNWNNGVILGDAQNMARRLQDTPANLLTPAIFVGLAQNELKGLKNVRVIVREREWVEQKGMGCFLSVSNGSLETPLKFLELHYNGGNIDDKPLGLVGKGVTFDSGGISIKPSSGMALMKGDMGGAAVTLSGFIAIAKLQLPINVVGLIPLTENMPSGTATKPGDLVKAMNGITVEVDNTDAEGRLILADALCYMQSFNPREIIEFSTLTGAMDVALGRGFAGVFSTNDELWSKLHKAGVKAGDEFWRMPFDDVYMEDIKSSVADLKNVGGRSAGACTAAIFLKEFVGDFSYAHVDIAGVMHHDKGSALLPSGMTGRPTRSLIEYAKLISKNQ